jgi:hypothetical protein
MSRKATASSRRPILSETEAALQWELRRAREELALLRKARRDQPDPSDGGLSPAGIAILIRKIGRMVRNALPEYLSADTPCPHCGGHSAAQIEAAFEAWAEAEAACEDIGGVDVNKG